ncbi:MAG: TIGR02281 family clan AA aspartic protease [Bauldia sp.]|nr:TIGR02281 family clan AA aspartic protease [Bauldia sp.]
MGARLLVIAAVVVVAALSLPKFAPDLLANLVGHSAAPASDEPEQRQALNSRRMILEADQRGHFLVDASVNGRAIEAMVDTGASTVALNAETARRLGVNPPIRTYTIPVSTANGTVRAAGVSLSEVRLGGIRLHNVEAMVLPDGLLATNLLGMSFLGRLSKFELSGSRLILVQ